MANNGHWNPGNSNPQNHPHSVSSPSASRSHTNPNDGYNIYHGHHHGQVSSPNGAMAAHPSMGAMYVPVQLQSSQSHSELIQLTKNPSDGSAHAHPPHTHMHQHQHQHHQHQQQQQQHQHHPHGHTVNLMSSPRTAYYGQYVYDHPFEESDKFPVPNDLSPYAPAFGAPAPLQPSHSGQSQPPSSPSYGSHHSFSRHSLTQQEKKLRRQHSSNSKRDANRPRSHASKKTSSKKDRTRSSRNKQSSSSSSKRRRSSRNRDRNRTRSSKRDQESSSSSDGESMEESKSSSSEDEDDESDSDTENDDDRDDNDEEEDEDAFSSHSSRHLSDDSGDAADANAKHSRHSLNKLRNPQKSADSVDDKRARRNHHSREKSSTKRSQSHSRGRNDEEVHSHSHSQDKQQHPKHKADVAIASSTLSPKSAHRPHHKNGDFPPPVVLRAASRSVGNVEDEHHRHQRNRSRHRRTDNIAKNSHKMPSTELERKHSHDRDREPDAARRTLSRQHSSRSTRSKKDGHGHGDGDGHGVQQSDSHEHEELPPPTTLTSNPFSANAADSQNTSAASTGKQHRQHKKYNETPVWRRNADGSLHGYTATQHKEGSRSSYTPVNKPDRAEKSKQGSMPLSRSALSTQQTNGRPHSAALLQSGVAGGGGTTANGENDAQPQQDTAPFYKQEMVTKSDKSFWPYYRLISDISQCDSRQLLGAIDSIFGLDSMQSVLRQFMIQELRHSLQLKPKDLVYLPPKELTRRADHGGDIAEPGGGAMRSAVIRWRRDDDDADGDTFHKMRTAVPSWQHPSYLQQQQQQQRQSRQNLHIAKNSRNISIPQNQALPIIESPNETDAKIEDGDDNFEVNTSNDNSGDGDQKQNAKQMRNKPAPINPNAAQPIATPNGKRGHSSSSTPSNALAHSVTSPTGDTGGKTGTAGAEIFDTSTTSVSLDSGGGGGGGNGDITPFTPYGGDVADLRHILLQTPQIGYRVVSFLDQRSLIAAHQCCRAMLYCCRLPEARSHLMIRVSKLASKMPISAGEFLKSRMSMLLHVQLLHLVIDKPKWDVLKILLSKLVELRQLDLSLPALQANYLMPRKMLSKNVNMAHLKCVRISGPRRLKSSQQYPDISFLLQDLLKRVQMPSLAELWLKRVAAKEKNTVRKLLTKYCDSIKSLELELSVAMTSSKNMLSEVHEYAKEGLAGKIPLKSLGFCFIRDANALFTYQAEKVAAHKHKHDGQDSTAGGGGGGGGGSDRTHSQNDNLIGRIFAGSPKPMNSNLEGRDSPLSLIGAMTLSTPQNAHSSGMLVDPVLSKILDDNEHKLRVYASRIVNELSDKVSFERLVYPGSVAEIHWNAINRPSTLRNLHVVVEPRDIVQGLEDLCTHCGHTLTNLKLTVHGLGNEDSHQARKTKSAAPSLFKIEQDLLHHLNRNLSQCTKLRHVRLVIGGGGGDEDEPTRQRLEIGRVSIDSFCEFMVQHGSTLSTVELYCYYLTFDFDKLKQSQSNKKGIGSSGSKFFIPNVKQGIQERLEELFLSCSHLRKIKIYHTTSTSKFIAVQRLFHGKPHTVGLESLDHFLENQFL